MRRFNKPKFWVLEYQWKSLDHYNSISYFYKEKSYRDSWHIDVFAGKFKKKESVLKSFKHKVKVAESYKKSNISLYQDIFCKNWRMRNILTDEIINLS